MPESWEEQRARLEAMAKDERGAKWDLSPNDRAAIRAALDRSQECGCSACVQAAEARLHG